MSLILKNLSKKRGYLILIFKNSQCILIKKNITKKSCSILRTIYTQVMLTQDKELLTLR